MADKEDDLKIGIQTSAITFGRRDAEAAMLCHALFVLLMAAAGCTIHARWPYCLALVYAVWHQCGQYRAIRSRNREACFKVFLSNNRIGWVLWLGLLAHYSGG